MSAMVTSQPWPTSVLAMLSCCSTRAMNSGTCPVDGSSSFSLPGSCNSHGAKHTHLLHCNLHKHVHPSKHIHTNKQTYSVTKSEQCKCKTCPTKIHLQTPNNAGLYCFILEYSIYLRRYMYRYRSLHSTKFREIQSTTIFDT